METIKQFIEQFILDEYNCNKAKTDITVTDGEYKTLQEKAYSHYHSIMPNPYGRGMSQEELLNEEPIYQELYRNNVEDAVPRTLFQIKQYEKPKLGEGLPRWMINDTLFACYTSYTEKSDDPMDYSTLFYVSETNEGLKIVYRIRYDSEEQEWRHSHDLKINQVKNPGKLITVEKYQAPEEKTSLADYNKP
ncbi:hypothetical protein [Chryseobacterium koreense]|uniref:Uncharacterized protein n=1 Tax=Chryseobacterium koreense CCUG 49689 TaxID=1304281 RepID=A0A0J7IWE9_9FLAO|nr:hypothetical protein [Chryseobacterium koreense]KMQ70287.1 hypothetical protein ACM44_13235 [Chryseobacterium koreense CCUG 49689]MBB5332597.1 hypothetical protein [Chryseobacterium koreense]